MSATHTIRRGEILSGIVIALLGAGTIVVANKDHALGTAARMGAGYMPTILGFLLVALGGLIALQAWLSSVKGGSLGAGLTLRPPLLMLGAVLLFALLIEHWGIIVASLLTVITAAIGSREAKLKETLALATALSFSVPLLFVQVLGLPLKVWPL
ncbi:MULTISPECIES: tripartite tricarboxylate transporter TctB family protein [unclassified Brenneria]|uniref:tripartite tricarboxylate transporter TctB family protein n=1 Tax=unclassified Brenneria TaxID=2634434 RepID=UPI0029C57ADD|nr:MULTISPECIES: tripartite tricarboxylate transporter TctB family protein [unclassified Brenneria]MDX5630915.1 tripartite tricarboxylate transporter TctB family protein [Brenneria sp. L3-3Z]MDX5697997.1 tripartite tricarboxylate transporter TctB family protein [Brenneria sp. L4-2C]